MIHYEKHPVSAERKAELRKKGFQILDAKFAPKQPEEPSQETKEKSPKK